MNPSFLTSLKLMREACLAFAFLSVYTVNECFTLRKARSVAFAPMSRFRLLHSMLCALLIGLALTGCGNQEQTDLQKLNLKGQVVSNVQPANLPAPYAAARFLGQASFGPTRESIEAVQSMGYEAWIDKQLLREPTQIDWTAIANILDVNEERDNAFYGNFAITNISQAFFSGEDQLRLRTTWAISNFIVVSQAKVFPTGTSEYFNKLQQFAFSNFSDLIYMIIRDPAMGFYLDNDSNKAPSKGCLDCSLNENFARELLQLFTVGVYRLNADGTIVRDAQGRPIEAYTQDDVQDMTRALSGWVQDNKHVVRSKAQGAGPPSNFAGFDKWMIDPYPGLHDSGSKLILGTAIPAGQTADKDARAVADLLTRHPNTAPFVVQRLIQFLVKSDPSPDYVKRVSQVFSRDSQGRVGNLAAVVKAILLDPEARLHDDPKIPAANSGRIKEPVLRAVNIMRQLECKNMLVSHWSKWKHPFGIVEQRPFFAPSVFSFYSPLHRSPGTNVKVPEQKLLTSRQFSNYFQDLGGFLWAGGVNNDSTFRQAGCELGVLYEALEKSPEAFVIEVNRRFFAGGMPASLRHMVIDLAQSENRPWANRMSNLTFLLSLILASPAYSVQS